MKKYLFCLVFCLLSVYVSFGEEYRKHVIVLIDQTLSPKTYPLKQAFEDIDSLLLKGKPIGKMELEVARKLQISDSEDQVSLFTSAIIPDGCDSIRSFVRTKPLDTSQIFTLVSNKLIHRECDFKSSSLSLSEFLERHLNFFMTNDSTEIRKKVADKDTYSFTGYLYPCILKHIDSTVPAEQYTILVLTDDRAGKYFSKDKDRDDLEVLVKKTLYSAFDSEISSLHQKYSVLNKYGDTLQWSTPNSKEKKEKEIVLHMFDVLQSSQSSQYIELLTIPDLAQIEYESDSYTLGDVSLQWRDTMNTMKIDSIRMMVRLGQDTLWSDTVSDTVWKNPSVSQYTLPKRVIQLNGGKNLKIGDKLNFKYIVYPLYDSNDDVLLPFVYTKSNDIVLNESSIKPKPDPDPDPDSVPDWLLYLIIPLILFVMWYLMKNQKYSCKIEMTSESPLRVMVNNNNYDCWYTKGMKRDLFKIYTCLHSTCKNQLLQTIFGPCLDCTVTDVNISAFRLSIEREGSIFDSDSSFPIRVGEDSFNVCVEVNDSQIDWTKSYLLSFNVSVNNSKGELIKEKRYEFVVRKISSSESNRNSWIAFDPGTSGSCVAIGAGGFIHATDNMFLVKHTVTQTGDSHISPIFDSKLVISTESSLTKGKKSVDDAEVGVDFYFDGKANQAWNNKNDYHKFQSIKKLLGYKDEFKLGPEINLRGADIAFLLSKALYKEAEQYVCDAKKRNDIRIKKILPDCVLPKHAIVAVPNNYTWVKIRDMLDTIKRLKTFDEVQYIYESEAVALYYIKKNWGKISSYSNKVFLVYDMGGATINVTVFTLDTKSKNDNVFNIKLNTIARVGYSIGGDNIDYAIMRILFSMPSVFNLDKWKTEDIYDYQDKYSFSILEKVRELKIDWIDMKKCHNSNNSSSNFITSSFTSFEKKLIGYDFINNLGITNLTDDDLNFLKNESKRILEQEFFSAVDESITEILKSIKSFDFSETDAVLLFGGRSVLYPGIEERVITKVKGHFKNVNPDRLQSDDELKTAVVQGACWYAMFSNVITLCHNIVTSSYGYLGQKNNETVFFPVIQKNTYCGIDGSYEGSVEVREGELSGTNVRFVQMFTSDSNINFNDDRSKYKYSILGESDNITMSLINKISLLGDTKNEITSFIYTNINKTYDKKFVASDTDIDKDNSRATVFAARPVIITATNSSQTLSNDNGEKPVGKDSQPNSSNRF